MSSDGFSGVPEAFSIHLTNGNKKKKNVRPDEHIIIHYYGRGEEGPSTRLQTSLGTSAHFTS